MAPPVIKSYPMSITYANARRIHISFPPRRLVRSSVIGSSHLANPSPIFCHPLRIFISHFFLFFFFILSITINKFVSRDRWSVVPYFSRNIYIYIYVYTLVRSVLIEQPRLLISRSNEALTHKGRLRLAGTLTRTLKWFRVMAEPVLRVLRTAY